MANIDAGRASAILGSMLGVNGAFPTTLANQVSLRLITATGITAASWAATANAGTGELAGTAGYATSGLTLNFSAISQPGTNVPPTSSGPTAAAGLSWTCSAGGGWLIQGFEIWDTATTRLRWWFGTFAGGTVTVANGQQLQIAQNAITVTLQ